jgi:hypothetical protein
LSWDFFLFHLMILYYSLALYMYIIKYIYFYTFTIWLNWPSVCSRGHFVTFVFKKWLNFIFTPYCFITLNQVYLFIRLLSPSHIVVSVDVVPASEVLILKIIGFWPPRNCLQFFKFHYNIFYFDIHSYIFNCSEVFISFLFYFSCLYFYLCNILVSLGHCRGQNPVWVYFLVTHRVKK